MAYNAENRFFPPPGLSISSKRLEPFGWRMAAVLGMAASGTVALFFTAQWTIALIGAGTVVTLSAIESEGFLLFVVWLTPIGWVLPVNVPGRNVPVVLRCLVVVGFFAGRLLRGGFDIKQLFRPVISRASVLFLCGAIVPAIFGKAEVTYESVRAVYALASSVGLYFVLLVWANSQQRIRKVLCAVLVSTLATAAFALYQQAIGAYTSLWHYLNPPDEFFVRWEGRSTSFLNHPNILAAYLNLVLPFALACCALGRSKWKILGAWAFGLGFIALLTTQSIGGLFAFVATVLLAIFCFVRSHKKKLALITGTCALVFLSYLARDILNPIHAAEENVGSDVSTRALLWETAWDEFVQFPVFGVGWGNFAAPYGWDIPSLKGLYGAHNLYLQILAETGLVGFAAFSYFVIRSLKQARNRWRAGADFLELALAFGVLGALLSILVHGFVDFPLTVQSGTLLWILLSLVEARSRLPGAAPVTV